MNVYGEVSQEFIDAAKFYACKLMDGRLHRHVNVEIVFVENEEFAGRCLVDDDSLNPRYFTIELNKNSDVHLLECLAHEMVHVRQYVTKQLIDSDQHVIWHGNPFMFMNGTHEEYWNYPWEKEAFDLQGELYEDWLSQEILD